MPEVSTLLLFAAAALAMLLIPGPSVLLVNVLNPKTAIFFLAFLPQFTDPARGPMWLQLAVLGACFIGLGLVTDGAYALTAGALAGRLRRTLRARRRLNRTSGAVYLGMGLTAALTGEARS